MKAILLVGASALALAVPVGAAGAETFTYDGHMDSWTVPKTGPYVIDAWGASGGDGGTTGDIGLGGLGVGVGGRFHLTAGETLSIAVGGRGETVVVSRYGDNGSGGGGGGSFVVDGAIPLVIGGGGGGGSGSIFGDIANGKDANPGPNGGGPLGYGGPGSFGGGGGGGFRGDGGNAYNNFYGNGPGGDGGRGFPSLAGGQGFQGGGEGGFGGGGGGYACCSEVHDAGGGGGYSGGAGNGGGGGSFDAGGRRAFLGYQTGNGLVLITGAVPEPTTWSLLLTGFGFLGFLLRRRMGGARITA